MDSRKKYEQMIEDGEISKSSINKVKLMKSVNILTDEVALEEWEEYYKINKDVLESAEDFEVAYGFAIWILNKNYKIHV